MNVPLPVVQPEKTHAPWLVVFTTLAQDTFGTPLDFGAGDGLCASARRAELAHEMRPLELCWLQLEHGSRVVEVPGSADMTKPIVADAVIVRQPGYAAALTTADCLPIVIACEHIDSNVRSASEVVGASGTSNHLVALIHAGWRGLACGVIERTLERLVREHGCDTDSMKVWIGPAIHKQDYEVGPDAHDKLLASAHIDERHFEPSDANLATKLRLADRCDSAYGHWLADLPAMAISKLEAGGVPGSAIELCPYSTKSDTRLHSVRRDGGAAGRMATVVGIRC
jgi:copper oxidase (laccase) domain-containing protein